MRRALRCDAGDGGGSGVTLSDSVESVLTPHLAPATLRGVVCIHHTNHTQGGNLNIEVGAINDVVFKRTRRDVNIHELADEVEKLTAMCKAS